MSLAVVRDLREARAPAGPDELAAFETDVLAGFVLARAAAGLSDNTIRSDVLHLEQLRAWFGRLDYVPGISQPPSTYSLTTCDLTSQEPGDLCAATRIARRPVDVRICMMSGRCQDSPAYHASRANLMLKSASLPLSRWVRATVSGSWPGWVCQGRGLQGAGTRAQRRGRWRRAPAQWPTSQGRT